MPRMFGQRFRSIEPSPATRTARVQPRGEGCVRVLDALQVPAWGDTRVAGADGRDGARVG